MLRECDPDTPEPQRHIELRGFADAVTSRILERNPKDEVFKVSVRSGHQLEKSDVLSDRNRCSIIGRDFSLIR